MFCHPDKEAVHFHELLVGVLYICLIVFCPRLYIWVLKSQKKVQVYKMCSGVRRLFALNNGKIGEGIQQWQNW